MFKIGDQVHFKKGVQDGRTFGNYKIPYKMVGTVTELDSGDLITVDFGTPHKYCLCCVEDLELINNKEEVK